MLTISKVDYQLFTEQEDKHGAVGVSSSIKLNIISTSSGHSEIEATHTLAPIEYFILQKSNTVELEKRQVKKQLANSIAADLAVIVLEEFAV